MKIALSLLAVVLILQPALALGETLNGASVSGILCQLFLGDIPLCPATSCKEIAEIKLWQPRSGQHWLTNGYTSFLADCVNRIPPSDSVGWIRVANVSSSQGCPSGLESVTARGRRLCRKTEDRGCSSVFFSTHGFNYTKVCGRVYGYQKDSPDGFHRHECPSPCGIDEPYLDGVSITYGSPRQHIFSLAAASRINYRYCPCSSRPRVSVPSFVRYDYFCEVEGHNTYTSEDRLWDGSGCVSNAPRCCDEGNWFCKYFFRPINDDIEFRVCTDQGRSNEDVYIEHAELYIQ